MLIGGLLGLGILARGSELVVVRAAGVSVLRIAVSACIAGLLIAMLTALLGEVVAPPVQKFARQQKAFSKFSDVSFAGSGSAWLKDGNTIISVHEQSGDNLFGGVYVCSALPIRSSCSRSVTRVVQPSARERVTGGWMATPRLASRAITSSRLQERTSSSRPRSIPDSSVSPRVNRVSCRRWICGDSSATCAPTAWKRRAIYLRSGRESPAPSRSSWWRFSPYPCAGAVALLGCGARIVIGVLIGIAFFLVQRTLESGSHRLQSRSDDPGVDSDCSAGAAPTMILIARTR